MRPLRVLHVSAYSFAQFGGVQRHVLDLSQALRDRGHDVLVMGPAGGEPVRDVRKAGTSRRISLAGTRFEITSLDKAESLTIDRDMRVWRPDIVHVHGIWVPFLPFQVLRSVKAARVATFHDTTAPGFTGALMRTAFKHISRHLLDLLDAAIAVSQTPLEHLRPGPRGVRPVIIPPVTQLQQFTALAPPPVSQPWHVVHWGRLEPRKDIGVFLDAIEKLHTRAGTTTALPRFTIAGDGPEAHKVKEAAARFGPGVLHYRPPPTATELNSLLASSHVSVFPAAYGESFGIVLAESLSSGRPAIAAANPGYQGVMTGMGKDLLFPPGDAEKLAEKIHALSLDAGRYWELVDWGRSHAAQFDVNVRAADFEDVYISALRQRSKREASGNHA
jgi:phosphatidylinositol alpha-mannosyltransferase